MVADGKTLAFVGRSEGEGTLRHLEGRGARSERLNTWPPASTMGRLPTPDGAFIITILFFWLQRQKEIWRA